VLSIYGWLLVLWTLGFPGMERTLVPLLSGWVL